MSKITLAAQLIQIDINMGTITPTGAGTQQSRGHRGDAPRRGPRGVPALLLRVPPAVHQGQVHQRLRPGKVRVPKGE